MARVERVLPASLIRLEPIRWLDDPIPSITDHRQSRIASIRFQRSLGIVGENSTECLLDYRLAAATGSIYAYTVDGQRAGEQHQVNQHVS